MIVAVLQARTGSTRLPGKVLRPLLGQPMLARQLERVRRAKRLDAVVVATSDLPADDAVAELCAQLQVSCFRGSEQNVLARIAAAAQGAHHVVRLTGDCPLSDPGLIDSVVEAHLAAGADLTSNAHERSFPDGLDVEVVCMDALETAEREASEAYEREHVTPFLYRRPERFRLEVVRHGEDLSHLRWTVDHEEDLRVIEAVFARLHPTDPAFTWQDVLALWRAEPDLFAANAHLAP